MTAPSKVPVLVTGGAGYIGSHTCRELDRAGYLPIAVDNLSTGNEWAVKWGPLEKGDILDSDFLYRVFKKYQPKAVLHFAAKIAVGESVTHPEFYYVNNVTGALTLLSAMLAHDVKRFVFSSSAATYGVPKQKIIDENHPQNPINPYGRTKLMIEQILRDYSPAYDLRSVALRYFNAAGMAPDGPKAQQSNAPKNNLVPIVMDVLTGKQRELTVYGDDYDTADGTCVRDYVHVEDLAVAHILALKHLENGGQTTAFNLGIGRGFSVKDVIQATDRVTGKKLPHKMGSRRPGDAEALVSDSTRAQRELHWKPKYQDIDSIIESAWRWHNR